jgi:hypothetical protein
MKPSEQKEQLRSQKIKRKKSVATGTKKERLSPYYNSPRSLEDEKQKQAPSFTKANFLIGTKALKHKVKN